MWGRGGGGVFKVIEFLVFSSFLIRTLYFLCGTTEHLAPFLWQGGAGRSCFPRTLPPALWPLRAQQGGGPARGGQQERRRSGPELSEGRSAPSLVGSSFRGARGGKSSAIPGKPSKADKDAALCPASLTQPMPSRARPC